MACSFKERRDLVREVTSRIKISHRLMFSKALRKKYTNSDLVFWKNKPTQWKITKEEMIKIIDLMVDETNGPGATNLPAGLTYIGQLIAHDIVTDSSNPDSRTTPKLNLDSLLPPLKEINKAPLKAATIDKFGRICLRKVTSSEEIGDLYDFLRTESCSKSLARIPDQRNDENVIIAQLGIFLIRLHNVFVEEQLREVCPKIASKLRFNFYKKAKNATAIVFQKIVIEEYLRTLLPESIFKHFFKTKSDKELYDLSRDAVPLEFSHAAFRFGHSMVRGGYKLRIESNGFAVTRTLRNLLKRGERIHESEHIDWRLFFYPPQSFDDEQGFTWRDFSSISIGLNFNNALPPSLNTVKDLGELKALHASSNRDKETQVRKKHISKHIVVEDIDASGVVPTGGDIVNSLYANPEHPLIRIAEFPRLKEYKKALKFENLLHKEWAKISIYTQKDSGIFRKESLSIDNTPFWLFSLLESTKLPPDESCPSDVNCRIKLGPLTSSIVGSTISNAIESCESNIWKDSLVAEYSELLPTFKRLIEMPSMLNLIEQVKTSEKSNEHMR